MNSFLWDFCNVAYEKDSKGKLTTVRYQEVDGVIVMLDRRKLSNGDHARYFKGVIPWDLKGRQSLVVMTIPTIKNRAIRDFILFHELGHVSLGHKIDPEDNLNYWNIRHSFVEKGEVQAIELEADAYASRRIGAEESLIALQVLHDMNLNTLLRVVDRPFMIKSRAKRLRLICTEFELRIKHLRNLVIN